MFFSSFYQVFLLYYFYNTFGTLISLAKNSEQTIMYTRQKDDSHLLFHISVTRLPLVLIYIFNSYFELLLVHRYTGLRATFNKVLL